MDNCIFCKIVRQEIPCYKVYEDDLFLGFLDIHPLVKGHTLLIPKKHFTWTYDVPEFDKYWLAALKITNKMRKVFETDFVTYGTHGLDVSHAHIHILPRKGSADPILKEISLDKSTMEEVSQELLKANL